MKKSYLMLLSSLALLGATAVAYKTATPNESQLASEPAAQKNMAAPIARVSSPQREVPDVYSIPFSFTPTQEQYDQCTIVNLTPISKTWVYDSQEKQFKYSWDSNHPADDWLITPGIQMGIGSYSFTWYDKTGGSYDEHYKVYITNGTDVTAEDFTAEEIYDSGEFRASQPTQREATFVIATPGIYHVALFACSRADQLSFNIWDLNITLNDPRIPSAPEITSIDFTGTNGSITVTAPTMNVVEEPIEGTMQMTVTIDNEPVEGSPFTVTPGQEVTINNLTLTNTNHEVAAQVALTIDDTTLESSVVSQTFRVTKLIEIPMPLPAYILPDEDEASVCTFINNNTTTWKFNNTATISDAPISAFQYVYTYAENADNWVILPAMIADETGVYKLDFKLASAYNEEDIEVYVGNAPTAEAMLATEPILERHNFKTGNQWTDQSVRFGHDAGNFYIGFHASSPSGRGFIYITEIHVIKDDARIPNPPTFNEINFDGSDGAISFTLPATTLANAPIAASTTINAHLSIDGTPYEGTLSGAPGQQITVNLTDMPRGNHNASVYATYTASDGTILTSESTSQDFIVTRPSSFYYSLPFTMPFDQESFEDLLIINNNNDAKTWQCTNGVAHYQYNSAMPADDWMMTLPVDIPDASKTYKVSIQVMTSGYDESFAIYLGSERTIEGMTNKILEFSGKSQSDYNTISDEFSVPAAGRYYVGIHCFSAKDMYNLYVKNMVIEEQTPETVPGQATDIVITPDPTGALTATVAFNMPVNDKSGNALPADQQLTATVTAVTPSRSDNPATVTGTPGQAVSVEMPTINGDQQFNIVVGNSDGNGPQASQSAYCGLDTPITPNFTDAYLSEDGRGVILKWNPVTAGVHGGALNMPAMMYRISEYDYEDEDWYAVDHIAETEYEYRVGQNTPQQFYTLGLEAYNSPSTNGTIRSIDVSCGKPYETPVNETFQNGEFYYETVYAQSTMSPNDAPSWTLNAPGGYVTDAALPSGEYALICMTTKWTADSQLKLPLISTENALDATFTLEVFTGSLAPKYTVFVNTYGSEEPIILGTIENTTDNAWGIYSFSLPEEMLGRPWVQVGIQVNFTNVNQYALIRNYQMTADLQDGVAELLTGNVRVFAADGAICIAGAEGQRVNVADISGKRIYSGEGTANMRIAAPAGVNIVTIGSKAYKIVVR